MDLTILITSLLLVLISASPTFNRGDALTLLKRSGSGTSVTCEDCQTKLDNCIQVCRPLCTFTFLLAGTGLGRTG